MLIARPLSAPAQVVGQHLHVARQHDQVDAELVDQLAAARPRPRPWSPGVTGRWWNGDAVGRAPAARRRGGWTPRRDLDLQRAGARAEQQVVEAVQVLGDHDQRAVRRARPPTARRSCRTASATAAKSARSVLGVDAVVGDVEVDPHEEAAGVAGRRTAGSPRCCRRARPGTPVTACTMPGRSGQDRVRTKSPTGSLGGPGSVDMPASVAELGAAADDVLLELLRGSRRRAAAARTPRASSGRSRRPGRRCPWPPLRIQRS